MTPGDPKEEPTPMTEFLFSQGKVLDRFTDDPIVDLADIAIRTGREGYGGSAWTRFPEITLPLVFKIIATEGPLTIELFNCVGAAVKGRLKFDATWDTYGNLGRIINLWGQTAPIRRGYPPCP